MTRHGIKCYDGRHIAEIWVDGIAPGIEDHALRGRAVGMSKRATFKQSDVRRVIRAAKAEGWRHASVTVNGVTISVSETPLDTVAHNKDDGADLRNFET
jgi:hypothetical protein